MWSRRGGCWTTLPPGSLLARIDRILVAHDFDVSGFGIFSTLGTDSRRYTFTGDRLPIIDIGLRLTDIREMNLESEPRGD